MTRTSAWGVSNASHKSPNTSFLFLVSLLHFFSLHEAERGAESTVGGTGAF